MSHASIRRHNQRLIQSLQPGDLVEFPRGAYSHWAVYVGGGKVIHFSGDDGDFAGKLTSRVKVREDDLLTVAGRSKARKNNLMDDRYRPFPRDEIVRRARRKIGHGGYNIIHANCEHFANWCRYDKAVSMQVTRLAAPVANLHRTAALAVDGIGDLHRTAALAAAKGIITTFPRISALAVSGIADLRRTADGIATFPWTAALAGARGAGGIASLPRYAAKAISLQTRISVQI